MIKIINPKKDSAIGISIRNIFNALTIVFFIAILFSACISEDLAFEVIESPVLATFEESVDTQEGILSMTATFYELDKSGILDQNIGIDSTLVTGLSLQIFVDESALVDEVMTDSQGKAVFEKSLNDLNGSRRIEWVGTHANTAFRIYRNF